MIGPADPRHGSHAGYRAHKGTNICDPCRDAAARYERHRKYASENGRIAFINSQGFRRRLHALQALGWSLTKLSEQLGMDGRSIWRAAHSQPTVTIGVHARMAAVYEQLSMTIPTGGYAERSRRVAQSKGYIPPLGWDNIDTDPEPPANSFDKSTVDHAAIQRVLDGDTTIKPTPTELKHIITTLHARGLTDAQIATRTNTKHNTIQATRKRLGLPLNPANLNWAEFGIKPRVRNRRNQAA